MTDDPEEGKSEGMGEEQGGRVVESGDQEFETEDDSEEEEEEDGDIDNDGDVDSMGHEEGSMADMEVESVGPASHPPAPEEPGREVRGLLADYVASSPKVRYS
jgi:hypothetical protein